MEQPEEAKEEVAQSLDHGNQSAETDSRKENQQQQVMKHWRRLNMRLNNRSIGWGWNVFD